MESNETEYAGQATSGAAGMERTSGRLEPGDVPPDKTGNRVSRYSIPYTIRYVLAEEKGLAESEEVNEKYWYVYNVYRRGLNLMLAQTSVQAFDDRLKGGQDGIIAAFAVVCCGSTRHCWRRASAMPVALDYEYTGGN